MADFILSFAAMSVAVLAVVGVIWFFGAAESRRPGTRDIENEAVRSGVFSEFHKSSRPSVGSAYLAAIVYLRVSLL